MTIAVLRGLAGKAIDLANNVFGVLPVANGGTGANNQFDLFATVMSILNVMSWINDSSKDCHDIQKNQIVNVNNKVKNCPISAQNEYCRIYCVEVDYGNKILISVGWTSGAIEYKFYYSNTQTWQPWRKFYLTNDAMVASSISAGSAPYKKGWRKLSAILPSAAGEVTIAHGITTIETVQGKVTDSDGLIVFNNDPDPARQFYIRVNGANLVLGVSSSATKIFGKTVTIYAGEEL